MSLGQPARRKPTIAQVAQVAGVSRASVSRAFTRPELLGETTVLRILEVAERIGYVPNPTARALSTGRSANLALVVPDVANPFFPPLIEAAQVAADRSDYCVFLGSSREDPEQEDKLIGRFADQVAGLILVSSRLPEARIRHHAQRRLIVLVNREVPGLPRVLIDSGRGVAEAVDHLAVLGHRRLAYLGGPARSWSDQQRREAVGAAARRHGLVVDMLAAELPTHEAGRAAAAALRATGATAVIAFDDLLAQGVMAGLSEMDLRVPEDMSVIGCDDVLGAATWPPLTTVSNRSAEAGRSALGMLVDLVTGGTPRDRRQVLDTALVLRRSTAAPPCGPQWAGYVGKAKS